MFKLKLTLEAIFFSDHENEAGGSCRSLTVLIVDTWSKNNHRRKETKAKARNNMTHVEVFPI